MSQRLLSVFVFFALCAAAVPVVVAAWLGQPLSYAFIGTLNFLGWGTVCGFLLARKGLLGNLGRALNHLNLPSTRGDMFLRLAIFFRETLGYPGTKRGEPGASVGTKHLQRNLRRVVKLAYDELHAQAAEISLYDETARLWSQAMIIGEPTNVESQSLILHPEPSEGRVPRVMGKVITKPLSFAGTTFGALRVELKANIEPAESDLQVLSLIAMQGALMLLDARFTDELLRMKRAGEESTQAKTGFLANLSHEIRGPLGIILNGVELMLDGLCGALTDSQKTTLRMIKDSGEHLLDLVNDVLDYAKIEAGKVLPKSMELALKPLMEDLVNVVRSQAQAKGHQLTLLPVDDTLGIICDKRHIRQMAINFLTNAVKYTPNGGKITVVAERLRDRRVKISVTDTGIGIPEKEKSKVFGAFERVDNEYALGQMGTGLGMPLTKKLAEVNGGVVDFESTEGKGSTFWIVLPACTVVPIPKRGSEEEEVDIPAQGRGESVLLVEHDEELQKMLEGYLAHQGFTVFTARTGREVVKALREREFDLAVIENDLAELKGAEVITAIRGNPMAASVPIVLLSARAFDFDIEQFLKLGVDRCLTKPVALSELAMTARRLIDEKKSLVAAPTPTTPVTH